MRERSNPKSSARCNAVPPTSSVDVRAGDASIPFEMEKFFSLPLLKEFMGLREKLP
jgi:hypothetical protein